MQKSSAIWAWQLRGVVRHAVIHSPTGRAADCLPLWGTPPPARHVLACPPAIPRQGNKRNAIKKAKAKRKNIRERQDGGQSVAKPFKLHLGRFRGAKVGSSGGLGAPKWPSWAPKWPSWGARGGLGSSQNGIGTHQKRRSIFGTVKRGHRHNIGRRFWRPKTEQKSIQK